MPGIYVISDFAKYFSLLFDANVSKESIYIYFDINGKMFNSFEQVSRFCVTTSHYEPNCSFQ